MITLVSSLLSGTVASIIVFLWTKISEKKEKRYEYKLNVFKDLIAYRNDITDGGTTSGVFETAINQVFVAYNDCPDVLEKFEKFREIVSMQEKDAIIDSLLQMLKGMAKELKIDYSFANDNLFTNPVKIGNEQQKKE